MASSGPIKEARGRRTILRWSRGLIMGLVIGAALGLVAGAVLGATAFGGGAALVASALGGIIFGGLVGAFLGGMSNLEDPPPGEEPGVRDRPRERPGLTHDEQEP